jgi:hypothetical protein
MIAQVGVRQTVVKHRPGADLLMRQNRAHPLLIEVSEQRKEVQCPLPGQVRQVRPVVRIEHAFLVSLRVVGRKHESTPKAPACDLLPEPVPTRRKALRKAVTVSA